jgi:hypothetical protein
VEEAKEDMDNIENIKQPNYESRQQYTYPQGPSASVLFHKSKLAKIGLILIILSIIGLIISFTVPWLYFQSDSSDLVLNHDFKDEDGNFFGYSDYGDMYTHYLSYITDAPTMADTSFIFLLILGIIAMIVGMLKVRFEKIKSLFSLSSVIIGAIALFPSLLVTIAGFRLLGFNVVALLPGTQSLFSMFGGTAGFTYYPAGYIIIIFGIIMLIFSFMIIRSGNLELDNQGSVRTISEG